MSQITYPKHIQLYIISCLCHFTLERNTLYKLHTLTHNSHIQEAENKTHWVKIIIRHIRGGESKSQTIAEWL